MKIRCKKCGTAPDVNANYNTCKCGLVFADAMEDNLFRLGVTGGDIEELIEYVELENQEE